MTKKQAPCVVCRRSDGGEAMHRGDAYWECSHVDCPNRRRVTARPGDSLARDSDSSLTSHIPPKDIES